MNQTPFGRMPDGQPVDAYTLTSGPLSCRILTYGGAVQSLTIPDRRGCPVDVVLGFDTLADYRTQDKYMGALVGRYANRIGGSTFMLNGTEYPLPTNDGPNHLHGGLLGFDRQLWTIESASENALTLSLTSPDGQEGYPGTLTVQAAYTLQDGALTLDLRARADRDTLCNLTGHTYFNLSGHQSGPVLGQYIQLFADHYTPSGPDSIPTGELAPVAGTPMDLRTPQPIGLHINSPFPQLLQAKGYDHNWALRAWDSTLRPAARAWSPDTGILLELSTTLPGLQLYTGNFLSGCPAGKGGAPYDDRWGFALEPQYFPDSPHHPAFPSPVLRAGAEYHQQIVYRFTTAQQLEPET